jgi:UPF0716 protein FxsA
MRKSTWVLLGVLALAVAEIWLLVWVGDTIGLLWLLAILAGVALIGTWLWRREGARVWLQLREAGDDPQQVGRRLSDAALVTVGGLMLMLPGFITDVVGLFFLLPFTRPLARRGLAALLSGMTRRVRDQADLMDARLRPDSVVPGRVEDAPEPPRRPNDEDVVIKGEIEP